MSDEKKESEDGYVKLSDLAIGPEDGAIILYANGKRELILPKNAAQQNPPSAVTMDALVAMVVLGDRPLYAAASCIINDEAKNFSKVINESEIVGVEEPTDPNKDPLN